MYTTHWLIGNGSHAVLEMIPKREREGEGERGYILAWLLLYSIFFVSHTDRISTTITIKHTMVIIRYAEQHTLY
jgi:hypothetical protein